jgi:hypothetical protein
VPRFRRRPAIGRLAKSSKKSFRSRKRHTTPGGQSHGHVAGGRRRRRNRLPLTYLVSGDENIRPSHTNLRQSGRRVRFDTQVNDKAAIELKARGRFVVVAHGRSDGTVMWFSSSRGTPSRWLWVGMADPPVGSRLYLYSCNAGAKLPSSLTKCECFGHSGDVPMPTGGTRAIVLRYLDEVDRLVQDHQSDIRTWRATLGIFINEALVEEAEKADSNFMNSVALQFLRRSLGYVDE